MSLLVLHDKEVYGAVPIHFQAESEVDTKPILYHYGVVLDVKFSEISNDERISLYLVQAEALCVKPHAAELAWREATSDTMSDRQERHFESHEGPWRAVIRQKQGECQFPVKSPCIPLYYTQVM